MARAQKGPLLETLKELVSIESGSRDLATRLIMDISRERIR